MEEMLESPDVLWVQAAGSGGGSVSASLLQHPF